MSQDWALHTSASHLSCDCHESRDVTARLRLGYGQARALCAEKNVPNDLILLVGVHIVRILGDSRERNGHASCYSLRDPFRESAAELSVSNIFVPDIEVSRLKAAGETELALILELLCDFHGGETIQARQKADLAEFLTSMQGGTCVGGLYASCFYCTI